MTNFNFYIDNDKLDLYKDEGVEITSRFQDITDLKKLKTDFSKSITIPASVNNNKVFSHYYNLDVLGGFDARVRTAGRIEFGGRLYKEGVWQLLSVNIKQGKPKDYKIQFFSGVVGLKDVFQDSKLVSLDMSSYDFTMSAANVKNKLTTAGDVVYTLLSKKEYYYNSATDATNTEKLTNIAFQNSSALNGVRRGDLRPSIKVSKIVDQIKTDYGLNFTGEIFNREEYLELYLALNHYDGIEDESTNYVVADRMPEVKIFDFIAGLVSLFKLVIIPSKLNELEYRFINVDEYYSESTIEHDITRNIDFDTIEVKPVKTFSEINYKFKEPKTRAQKAFESVNNRYYGDLEEEITDDLGNKVIGGEETIKLPFEVVLLERLMDIENDTMTNVQYGLCTNDSISNQEKIPFLHYVDLKDLTITPIAYRGDLDTDIAEEIESVNTAVTGAKVRGNYNFGCIFNTEFDTYNQNLLERNFFSYYHFENVEKIFRKENRLYKGNGFLTFSQAIKIELNDTIKIKGNRFYINDFTYNLTTKKAVFNLFKRIDDVEYQFLEKGAYSDGFSNGFFK